MRDTLTIYWAPANFSNKEASYNMAYRKPESLLNFIHGNKFDDTIQTQCPALKDTLNNLYVFKSSFDDEFDIDPEKLSQLGHDSEAEIISNESLIGFNKFRPSQLKGYVSAMYNLRYLFFADEPVKVKFTAPYYPAITPVEGALMATGEFDIGRWYRPFDLDYHIPLTSTKFKIKENDPLFFMQVDTDKKVVFERYNMSDELINISLEMSESPLRYGKHKSLEDRYHAAEESMIPQIVLNEIRKNIV